MGRLVRRTLAGNHFETLKLDQLWRAKRDACEVTHAHEIGVGVEVKALSELLGWDRSSVDDFQHAAAFHDVGKMLTPREVLWKTSRLTSDEMEIMKRHAVDGAGILARFGGMMGEIGAQMAHYHHERPDGLGYHGLKGRDIPVFARICAVADVFEAMTSSHRSYKAGFTVGETLVFMTRRAAPGQLGRDAFDPDVLHGFVRLKLAQARGELGVVEAAAIKEFERTGGVGRRAELAAFRIGLDNFGSQFAKDPEKGRAMAARLQRAAFRDQEKQDLLQRHADGAAIRRISGFERRSEEREVA